MFFRHLQIFLKLTFSKKSFRNTIKVSNSLDPDQAKGLQMLSADSKSRQS